MKKHLISIIALALAAASLVTAVVLGVQLSRCKADIDALNYLVEDLRQQVSALSGQPADSTLGEVTINAARRNDGLADVELTLIPAQAGTAGASLKILSGETLLAQADCQWDGQCYTARAAVEPVNGCTYILTVEDTEYVLASPTNGAYPDLVNLSDSLSAYCNLILGDWITESGKLILDTCHLQVQAPLLGTVELPGTQEVRIMLKHRGDLVDGVTATLEPGEGAASYEGILTGLSLTLPELAEGDAVEVWMEATLADGQMVTTCAGTWTRLSGNWEMAAG